MISLEVVVIVVLLSTVIPPRTERGSKYKIHVEKSKFHKQLTQYVTQSDYYSHLISSDISKLFSY